MLSINSSLLEPRMVSLALKHGLPNSDEIVRQEDNFLDQWSSTAVLCGHFRFRYIHLMAELYRKLAMSYLSATWLVHQYTQGSLRRMVCVSTGRAGVEGQGRACVYT
jgi:hypothetical protein